MSGVSRGLQSLLVSGTALCRRRVGVTVSCVCALCLCSGGVLLAQADDGGDVAGATFQVDDGVGGTLTYEVTSAAGTDGVSGEATLADGSSCRATDLQVGTVAQMVGGVEYIYEVTGVATGAFRGNSSLQSISFDSDLTSGIGANAFRECTALKTATLPQKVAGIGNYAFYKCESLASVTFAEDAELYFNSRYLGNAIGAYAFGYCTSLTELSIPAITSATRFGDYYHSFEDYNPGSTQMTGGGYTDLSKVYESAYVAFWHSGYVPVARGGISGTAFDGCSALETLLFEPGNNIGAYAYFLAGDSFTGCESLKALVYESDQAYWTDPNGAMHNGTYANINEDAQATLYYAVDYYCSANDAESDDARASHRIARVEYEAGTSTAAIATSDVDTLTDSMFSADAYAQDGYADGQVPDPDEAAAAAGYDTSKEWVWQLSDTQSRRGGLSESCCAYLAPADDISAGRIAANEISVMYKLCDQNYSQGSGQGVKVPVEGAAFDVARYYGNSTYVFDDLDEGTPWFTVKDRDEESFLEQIEVVGADGAELTCGEDYTASYQYYDADSHELTDCGIADGTGPVLVTITPTENSGLTGILQDWVLVKGYSGSVEEMYTDSAAETDSEATHYMGGSSADVNFSGCPYVIDVGASDLTGALVACGYAGLAGTAINVGDSTDGNYGFSLSTGFYASGVSTSSGTTLEFTRSSDSFDSAAEYAVSTYTAFERQRSRLGVSSSSYPWGGAAVLVNPSYLEDVAASAAAYAYAQKACVFYTEDDGTVSADTLACLEDFDEVVVIGDTSTFSAASLASLSSALSGVEVTRISGDARNVASLSMAVADELMVDGLAAADIVTISDAGDAMDAIAALDLSGSQGGLTLVSGGTAESKALVSYLRDMSSDISVVRLFGRDASNVSSSSFDLADMLGDLWKYDFEDPVAGAGDTITFSGVRFSIGEDGTTLTLTFKRSLWAHDALAAGTYSFNGASYVLTRDVDAYELASFPDVADSSAWYYTPVYYINSTGAITGYENGNFGVGDTMTRAQVASIMWRLMDYDDYVATGTGGTNTSGLSDVEDGKWYTSAVNWAVKNGVFSGYENGTFKPNKTITFQEFCRVIVNACGIDADSYSTSALSGFKDGASVASWAQGPVAYLVDEGIVSGNSDGTLRPATNIKRERGATVLYYALKLELI